MVRTNHLATTFIKSWSTTWGSYQLVSIHEDYHSGVVTETWTRRAEKEQQDPPEPEKTVAKAPKAKANPKPKQGAVKKLAKK